jgi:hypothetical protein
LSISRVCLAGFSDLSPVVGTDLSAIMRAWCDTSIRLWGYRQGWVDNGRFKKNRPPERRPINLTREERLLALAEEEADTGAYEVLPQIPTLAGLDLGARVIEVVVFDKSTKVVTKEVI